MINARQETKVSGGNCLTLYFFLLSLHLSMYAYIDFFSLFEKNFLNVSNQNEGEKKNDEDELLNLMLKSSACQRTEKEKKKSHRRK